MNELSCQDLRTLYRETPTAIVLVGRKGRITDVNRQAADLSGWAVEELMEVVGGRFELESEPGRGTVVRVRVPPSGSDGDQP